MKLFAPQGRLAFYPTIRSILRPSGRKRRLPSVDYLAPETTSLNELAQDVKRVRGARMYVSRPTEEDKRLMGTRKQPQAKLIITNLNAENELRIRVKHRLRLLPRKARLQRVEDAIKIKFATDKDFRALVGLEKICFEKHERATEKVWKDRLARADVLKAIDKKTGELVGFIVGSVKVVRDVNSLVRDITEEKQAGPFGYHYQLIDMGVLPRYRLQGVGGALIERGVELAATRKSTKVFGYAINPQSHALLEKNGFVLDAKYNTVGDISPQKRVYVANLATGKNEDVLKRQHRKWWKALQKLLVTKEVSKDIKNTVEGIRKKYPEVLRLKGERQAEITKRIIHDYLLAVFGEDSVKRSKYFQIGQYKKQYEDAIAEAIEKFESEKHHGIHTG